MNILEIEQKTKAVVCHYLSIDESKVKLRKTLRKLGADSLDVVEIFMELEKEFGIDFVPIFPNTLYSKSIGSICKYIEKKLLEKTGKDWKTKNRIKR